jgi:transcriptional repressor NrdR
MRCPSCKKTEDKVIDSRSAGDETTIRRRRECLHCGRRFTTYEHIEEMPLLVVKKDQRRETYDRNKVLMGIQKACEKRPVSAQSMEQIVDRLEKKLEEKYEKEAPSSVIGEYVMEELVRLDQVAYVRFASVYRQFKDINHFLKELKGLLSK